MNKICDCCDHQEIDNRGGVRCGAGSYKITAYGTFKQGAVCCHDDELKNEFQTRTENSSIIKDLSKRIEKLENDLMKKRDKIDELKRFILQKLQGVCNG